MKGSVDSAGDAALNTVTGWAWALQDPGTALETAKLVGGDIQRALERQMNEDPSGFGASTVLNLGYVAYTCLRQRFLALLSLR
ncbi:MAG: hypothetical protein HC936_07780 [Leptolyngbyaceae cyanobacterium SU_3_3]|nr:hypothetical protein [Leptolyngbyaceae cyanobacterium SU_3_3]